MCSEAVGLLLEADSVTMGSVQAIATGIELLRCPTNRPSVHQGSDLKTRSDSLLSDSGEEPTGHAKCSTTFTSR